jgi:hypothetical protein
MKHLPGFQSAERVHVHLHASPERGVNFLPVAPAEVTRNGLIGRGSPLKLPKNRERFPADREKAVMSVDARRTHHTRMPQAQCPLIGPAFAAYGPPATGALIEIRLKAELAQQMRFKMI